MPVLKFDDNEKIIYRYLFPNGKSYIGLTTQPKNKRNAQHKSCSRNTGNTRFVYNAIRKYGFKNLIYEILDTAENNDELREKEKAYIFFYNSYYINGCGYNRTIGGDGGYVFTEEDKQKMSEAHKKRDPDTYKKQGVALSKYYEEHPEAGQKHGIAMSKYYEEHPEQRERASERTIKQFENPEARQQMSEIKKIYYEEHPEAGQKHGDALKKYFEETPGAREKNSEALKKYFEETPGARQKCSEAQKKRFEKPGAREKNSEAQKTRFTKPGAREHLLNKRGKNKPFDVITKDGTFVKTFTYQMEAREYLQKEYHITSTIKMSEVLSGKRNNSAGFIFKYK